MNIFYNIFLYTVWFFATYYVVLILLIMFLGKDNLREKRKMRLGWKPKVSVIVPAYNEEGKIKHTINSLKKTIYDNIEIIVISDGSRDGTALEAEESIGKDPRFVLIDRKDNRGKAATLNQGISRARGEFIATMDADSIAEPRVFEKTLPYFDDEKVAAVTVSVLVKNPKTFLHKIFELEYIIGLSLLLKAFSFFDGVFVTPGPFSIYRKSALKKIGGFDEHNITEDMEIAYRIQKAHYKIANCMEAKVYTIVPPTFRKICVQRKRWYSGAVYTLAKHRDVLLNNKYGLFGYFVFLNYSLIALGLSLFLYSIYLGVTRMASSVSYFQYTNFNFIQQLKYISFDALSFSRASVLGIISGLFTLVVLAIGLYLTRTAWTKKKIGVIGYPFLFFFYQIFWIISLAAVVRGKKIKWR